MIKALVRGHLSREQENMEDLLTSAVFGRLRYLKPREGVLPFLSAAIALDGSRPFSAIPEDARVTYVFWPQYAEPGCEPCEPDMELQIDLPDKRRMVVFVEVKFRSGKSSEEDEAAENPRDQLAKEWDNLIHQKPVPKNPVLVYLTADVGVPREDMEASIAAFVKKRGGDAPTICWVSWRHLHEVLNADRGLVHKDLLDMLERLDLHFFRGVGVPSPMTAKQWTFGRFDWGNVKCQTSWKFKGGSDE